MIFNISIYILAGLSAGVLTGFAGISAAVVVTPALVSLCGFDAYEAVGIAMASDVIASAVTSYSYSKHGHLHIREAVPLMVVVLCFTLAGSWLGNIVPHAALATIAILLTPLMGLKFLFFPETNLNRILGEQPKKRIFWEIVGSGIGIGLLAGFAGAGGGEMLLMALTIILAYDVKDAVGTGVFIMAFVSLVGCVSHIYIGGFPDVFAFVICILGNLTGALFASRIGNKVSSSTLNKIIGVFLVCVGIFMALVNFIG